MMLIKIWSYFAQRTNYFYEFSTRFDANKVSKVFLFNQTAENKSFNFQPNGKKLQDSFAVYGIFKYSKHKKEMRIEAASIRICRLSIFND